MNVLIYAALLGFVSCNSSDYSYQEPLETSLEADPTVLRSYYRSYSYSYRSYGSYYNRNSGPASGFDFFFMFLLLCCVCCGKIYNSQ